MWSPYGGDDVVKRLLPLCPSLPLVTLWSNLGSFPRSQCTGGIGATTFKATVLQQWSRRQLIALYHAERAQGDSAIGRTRWPYAAGDSIDVGFEQRWPFIVLIRFAASGRASVGRAVIHTDTGPVRFQVAVQSKTISCTVR